MTDERLLSDLRDNRFDGQSVMRASAANRIEELKAVIRSLINLYEHATFDTGVYMLDGTDEGDWVAASIISDAIRRLGDKS